MYPAHFFLYDANVANRLLKQKELQMTTDNVPQNVQDEIPQMLASSIESVLLDGDLSRIPPQDRMNYYLKVCKSMGINPQTKPFSYIRLNGKLTLYALKGCADQLRKVHKVSITKMETEELDGVYCVTAYAVDGTGRTDSDMGAVPIQGLKGEQKANTLMKAITKAKRRVTLSICGLGMLDETEVESIKNVQHVDVEEAHRVIEQTPIETKQETIERVQDIELPEDKQAEIMQDAVDFDSLKGLEKFLAENQYDSFTYVTRLQTKKDRNGNNFMIVTFNEPVGGPDGIEKGKRQEYDLLTWDKNHMDDCCIAHDSMGQVEVRIDHSGGGKTSKIASINIHGVAGQDQPSIAAPDVDELPF